MASTVQADVYAKTVIHLLHMYDRFEKHFDRWSVQTKEDRISIVVTLKPGAIVSDSLVNQLHLCFPAKMQGPYLHQDDSKMIVEILTESNSEAVFCAPKEYQEEERDAKRRKLAPVTPAGIDAKRFADSLRLCIQSTNNSLCTLDDMETGRDENGIWIRFALRPVGRINLSFLAAFRIMDVAVNVRDVQVYATGEKKIFLRMYEQGQRRVVTKWEVVPNYKQSGVFVSIRSATTFD